MLHPSLLESIQHPSGASGSLSDSSDLVLEADASAAFGGSACSIAPTAPKLALRIPCGRHVAVHFIGAHYPDALSAPAPSQLQLPHRDADRGGDRMGLRHFFRHGRICAPRLRVFSRALCRHAGAAAPRAEQLYPPGDAAKHRTLADAREPTAPRAPSAAGRRRRHGGQRAPVAARGAVGQHLAERAARAPTAASAARVAAAAARGRAASRARSRAHLPRVASVALPQALCDVQREPAQLCVRLVAHRVAGGAGRLGGGRVGGGRPGGRDRAHLRRAAGERRAELLGAVHALALLVGCDDDHRRVW
eukprot:6183158-Pleurochrysis_carterae.AAC.2